MNAPAFFLEKMPFIGLMRESLKNRPVYLKKNSSLVFVCGATGQIGAPKPRRDEIIDYAKRHLRDFRFFKAEEVFIAIKGNTLKDLLSLENDLGQFSDCIIIVCESESAFTELGAFTLSDQLIDQVLIINDKKFQSAKSFINLGPIARADIKSRFRPSIFTNFNAILHCIDEVRDKLNKIPNKKKRAIPIRTASQLRNLKPKLRLLFICDLIHLFGPLNKAELISLLLYLFNARTLEISTELALAEGLGLIRRQQEKIPSGEYRTYYMHIPSELDFFFEIQGINYQIARASVVAKYYKSSRYKLNLLLH